MYSCRCGIYQLSSWLNFVFSLWLYVYMFCYQVMALWLSWVNESRIEANPTCKLCICPKWRPNSVTVCHINKDLQACIERTHGEWHTLLWTWSTCESLLVSAEHLSRYSTNITNLVFTGVEVLLAYILKFWYVFRTVGARYIKVSYLVYVYIFWYNIVIQLI